MNVFEDQLTRDLARAAAQVKLPAGRVATPLRIARRRQVRNRRAGVLASLLVVTGVTVGIIAVASRPSDQRKVTIGNGAGPAEGFSDETGPGQLAPRESGLAPANLEASPLTWTVADADLDFVRGGAIAFDSATGTLYGVSSSPPVREGQLGKTTTVRSTDGVSWDQLAELDDQTLGGNLAAYAGTLYAVGTAATTHPITDGEDWGDLVSRVSTDGVNWTTALLPGIDLQAIRAKFGGAFSWTLDVAAGPKGALIAESVGAVTGLSPEGGPERPSFLPPELNIDLGYEITTDGIQTFKPPCPNGSTYAQAAVRPDSEPNSTPACIDESGNQVSALTEQTPDRLVPWAELGVSSDDAAMYVASPRYFLSTDGATFQQVTLPPTHGGFVEAARIVADKDGFVVATRPRSAAGAGDESTPAYVFVSPDGRTWTEAPPIENVIGVSEVVRVNGEIAVIAEITGVGLATARLGTEGWTIFPIGDLLGRGPDVGSYMFPYQVAAGPAGIATAINVEAPELPLDVAPHVVDHDQYSIVAISEVGGLVVIDADGNFIGNAGGGTSPRPFTGPLNRRDDGAIDVFRDDATVVDTFTSAEIEAGWAALSFDSSPFTTIAVEGVPTASTPPNVFDPAGEATTYIAFSRDLGTTWSLTPLGSLIDEPFDNNYLSLLMVTNDAVVAELILAGSTPERPARKVLRGTL